MHVIRFDPGEIHHYMKLAKVMQEGFIVECSYRGTDAIHYGRLVATHPDRMGFSMLVERTERIEPDVPNQTPQDNSPRRNRG